jgi:protein phosphatase
MANNAHDRKELKESVNELIEEELPVDEESLPQTSKTVEEAVKQILPDHYTYGIKDSELKKPYSKLNVLPNKMYAYSGNEEGELNIVLDQAFASGLTHKSKYKSRNEDGIFLDADTQTAMITDGVGSTMHSEIASNVAIHSMAQILDESRKQGTPPLPLSEFPARLHKAVLEYQKNNKESNTAATLVAARIKPDKKVEFVHSGDSKALLIRGKKVVWQNTEDNVKEYLKARYNLKSDEEVKEFAEDHPQLRLDSITQCLGMEENTIQAHHHTEQADSGDIILLCSDGLTDTINPEELAKFIQEKKEQGMALNNISKELQEYVLNEWSSNKGKPDNLTFLLIELE